jgi:hypothetical protein
MDNVTLSIIETLKEIIIGQVGELVYPEGKKSPDIFQQSAAYIKFLPITACIEFMGACYDEQPFETTRIDKQSIVETRFNTALKKLFNKKYHPFANANNDYYFYMNLRNSMIHQLRPRSGIAFTTRKESLEDKTEHLKVINNSGKDWLILVLEDFYDDLKIAAEKLIRSFENGTLTNKKGENSFLNIFDPKSA